MLNESGGYGVDDNRRVIVVDTTKILNKTDKILMAVFLCRIVEQYSNQAHQSLDEPVEIIRVSLVDLVEFLNVDGSFYMGNMNPDIRGSRFFLTRLFGDVVYEKFQKYRKH